METLKEQIYNTKATFDSLLKHIENDQRVLTANRTLILKYKDTCMAKGLSEHRIMLLLRHLRGIGILCKKPFKEMTRADMETVLAQIEGHKTYSQWTKESYKIAIKQFYRWLFNLESTDTLPDVVRWIKGTKPPSRLSKDDLITQEELEAMLLKCKDVMKRAMLSVLYEGSLRPLEHLTTLIKDVVVEPKIIRVKVRGKMEKKQGDREVYLVRSYDYLKEWLERHPFRDDPNHALWIVQNSSKLNGKPLSMRYLDKFLKEIAKDAGIKKRVYPYLFRHSRGTAMYKEIGEALAKRAMGHSADSRMARVYNHLNDEDVQQAIMQLNGIVDTEAKVAFNSCPKCKLPIPYGAKECKVCGLPLTTEKAMELRAAEEEKERQFEMMKNVVLVLERSPQMLDMFTKELPKVVEQMKAETAKQGKKAETST